MPERAYLMESDTEIERLEMKTRGEDVVDQARWAGIAPGQRVADIGCGSGKTSFHLLELVQPGGEVVGIDGSVERIAYARENYKHPNLSFVCRDFLDPLSDLGGFDFIWIRFILEYYRNESAAIVQRAYEVLNPGGILCLIDLDHNCLSHHELPPRLAQAIMAAMNCLEQQQNFDPFAGRKLYTRLYDLGMSEIQVDMRPHHLIYGDLNESDKFNWEQKMWMVAKRSEYFIKQYYDNGAEGFCKDFQRYFSDPRRFAYTPLILCCGRKVR
ncbi:MAG: class I SAM-dependent methyltransferase [Desulfobacteraceae bacterium]|jgi:SAM-dependent methyltransferase|nr:class I SAM-dependent methyltransferase [Desulfobacteraceae bacterium]